MVSCDSCRTGWDDDHDHGTHVAGIAGAVANEQGIVGVTTHATLHAVKVVSADGHGDASTIAAGLKWVADKGYDVANLSLGSTSPSEVIGDAVRYAYERGVLVVAAAGNEEPDEHRVHYPAAFPEAIAVGATTEDDDLADFSLTGEEVELVAPGDDIPSTVIDDYAVFSGTSMATPHVSGAAGLLRANGYSKAEVRERLTSTAIDLGLDSDEQGNGLIDVPAALGTSGGDGGFSVSTRGATNVEPPNATLNGELLGLGDHSATTVGFEYWVKGDRSGTAKTVEAGSKSAAGMFSADVGDLADEETYVFVASATADGEEIRGSPHEFSTGSDSGGAPLTVETGQPTPVEEDEVTLAGRVTGFGGSDEVETYFEYWEEGRKDETLDDESSDDLEEPGTFTEDVDDFEPDTTYVVVAHAVDEDDDSVTGSGEPVTFSLGSGEGSTEPSLAIETRPATDVDDGEAELRGEVTEMTGVEVVTVSFEYWEKGNSGSQKRIQADELDELDDFDGDAEDLECETTYVAVARGVTSDGLKASGSPVEFTTKPN
ncbi:S8 family peptidase [Haloarculaceae archaeon H-GB2-1]|nr:S8 family peptidase [Haloarculaceae archaeon H-GB2-1]